MRLFVLGIALALSWQFALSSTELRGDEPEAGYKTALDEALELIYEQRTVESTPKLGDEENDYGELANRSLDDFDGLREKYDVDRLLDRLLGRVKAPMTRASDVLRDLEHVGDRFERDRLLDGPPIGGPNERPLGFGRQRGDLAGPHLPPLGTDSLPPGARNSDRTDRLEEAGFRTPGTQLPQGADGVPEQRETFSRDRRSYSVLGNSTTERRRFDSYRFGGTARPIGGRSTQATARPGAPIGPPNAIGAPIGPTNPFGR